MYIGVEGLGGGELAPLLPYLSLSDTRRESNAPP